MVSEPVSTPAPADAFSSQLHADVSGPEGGPLLREGDVVLYENDLPDHYDEAKA